MSSAVSGEALAHHPSALSGSHLRRIALVLIALALAVTLVAVEAPTAAQAAKKGGSEAARVIRVAKSHIGARFRIGTTGMRYFDCSGFVYRSFKQAGLLKRVGGSRKRAAGYYNWFRRRGLVSRKNPKPGDLIVWGKRGKGIQHIGIFMHGNRAISALVMPWGVRTHRVGGLHMPFKAYLHVRLDR